MNRAFTLIEVLVSVFLVFIIGLTLTKISSQNINTIKTAKDDNTFLHSSVINNINSYRDINDYINIRDIPRYSYSVDKKRTHLNSSMLILSDSVQIPYILEKETITNENKKQSFFRIK